MKGSFSGDSRVSRAYAQMKRRDRQAMSAASRNPLPLPPAPNPEQWARAMAETGGKAIAAAELIAQWNAASHQESKP